MTLSDPIAQDPFMNGAALMDASQIHLTDIPFFDGPSLAHLLFRFGFNLLVSWVIIQFFYYKKSDRRDFYFTFLMFSVTVFLLIFLMDNVKLQLGMALGLFAIFGIIRYRTETVSIREMTYLFIIIGLSVINGLAMTVSYAELIVTNLIFIVVTWMLENTRVLKHTAFKIILYDKIHLIVPEREAELMEDIRQRTGLDVIKVEIGNIDFLRDVAYIKVFYRPSNLNPSTTVNSKQLKPENF